MISASGSSSKNLSDTNAFMISLLYLIFSLSDLSISRSIRSIDFAGFGGAVAAPFVGAYPTIGTEQIFNAVAVVVVGGMGSFTGSFYAALLLGFLQYIVNFFVPELAMVSTLAVMLIVILLKPNGLFGGKKNG